jgi:hypothetical protein
MACCHSLQATTPCHRYHNSQCRPVSHRSSKVNPRVSSNRCRQATNNPCKQVSKTRGFGNGSPFADPPRAPFQPLQVQPTGYNSFQPSPLNPQATGVNRFLPPALAPQPTGFMSTQNAPPMPPMPPMPNMPNMPNMQPLVPQKTGPPPSIKFGVQAAKKLTPQPTGRASLANASTYHNTSRSFYMLI